MTEAPDEGQAEGPESGSDAASPAEWGRYQEWRRRRQAEAEAMAWREEALSHRRRLGIPAGGVWSSRAMTQTAEPDGSDESTNQEEK